MQTAGGDTSARAVADRTLHTRDCHWRAIACMTPVPAVPEQGHSSRFSRAHLVVAIAVAHSVGIFALDDRAMLHGNVSK